MIFKLVLSALMVTLALIVLKDNYRSLGMVLSVAGCAAIFIVCSQMISLVMDTLGEIQHVNGIRADSISVIVKTLAVAYLTSFGTDICNDAGEKAIANALEAAGKIIMLSMALPMLSGIFKSVAEFIG